VRGDATSLLLQNGLGALAIDFERRKEVDDGSYEEFRSYRKAVVVRGRTECSGMMKCEARLRSCLFVGNHQALLKTLMIGPLICHMSGVAIESIRHLQTGEHIFHFTKAMCLRQLGSQFWSHEPLCNHICLPFTMTQLQIHGYHCAPSTFFTPFVSTTGIGIGPPGESGNLAVKISTPSAVTRRVCSATS
jgi:hypothetical protein